jgi:HlyD family type I secretion membrane fusion protein
VQKTRLITLKRVLADYEGRLGDQRSAEAQARQRLSDLQLRAAQARNAYQQQAADELKDLAGRLREIEERLRPAEDQSDRLVVRAPVAGTVMALRATNAGQSIGPREPLMELAPADEELIVETRVRPDDIDHVAAGGHAEVRFTALDHRRAPNLPARVIFISPDRVDDPRTGTSWFVVQVRVDAASIASHHHIKVHAGLPAEVYIASPPRSLLDYLLEPLNAFKERAMREP